MTRRIINPYMEFIYPDRGGYTGFSIFAWKTNYANTNDYYLMSKWGGVVGSSELQRSKCVIEARFFVFGVLLKHILVGKNSHAEIKEVFERIQRHWTQIMDKITNKIKLKQEELFYSKATGVHVDDIIDENISRQLDAESSL